MDEIFGGPNVYGILLQEKQQKQPTSKNRNMIVTVFTDFVAMPQMFSLKVCAIK